MEENNNQGQAVDTEEIKRETMDTVNQVKDTIKNVNIKEDAKEAKGFFKSLFKDPLATIKSIANDNTNKNFKTACIFIIAWMVIILVDRIFDLFQYSSLWKVHVSFKQILGIIKAVLVPALSILVLSAITYFMNKDNKKSLVTTITTITTAHIPTIVATLISLITIFSTSAYRITNPISSICSIISTVLTYFAVKSLFNEEDTPSFFKKFVIIEVIYYVAYIILSFLEIYI